VRECLLRSLGLPGLLESKQSTHLNIWNKVDSKTGQIKQFNPPEAFTDLDMRMLETLYKANLKPGMSVRDVGNIISTINK
jgi:hypothetical protein